MVFLGSWRCQAQTSPTQLLYLALPAAKALFESDAAYDEKRRQDDRSASPLAALGKTVYCLMPRPENMISALKTCWALEAGSGCARDRVRVAPPVGALRTVWMRRLGSIGSRCAPVRRGRGQRHGRCDRANGRYRRTPLARRGPGGRSPAVLRAPAVAHRHRFPISPAKSASMRFSTRKAWR